MEILEVGYPKASISSTARRAHVSIRTFYEHYRNKEELFLDSYTSGYEFSKRFIEESINSHECWPDRVVAMIRAPLEIISCCRDYDLGLFIGSISAGPRALAARAKAKAETAALLRRELLVAARSDPELREFAIDLNPTLGLAVVAGGESIIRKALASENEHATKDLLPLCVYLVTSVAGLSLSNLQRLNPDVPRRTGLVDLISLLLRFEESDMLVTSEIYSSSLGED